MSDLEFWRRTPFYRRRISVDSLPFTTKAELVADQAANPPYGTNLARPISEYTRLHQTSGTTTGRPLCWLDTPASWSWILDRWDIIYSHMGLRPDDRLFFAFSFGPFLGFWSAFEAAQRSRHFCLVGGGMTSTARLRQIIDHRITAVLCTPTYALHLADVARDEKLDLQQSTVRAVIVAGEPGGLIATTRQKIEAGWGARVFDHYGLTEVGPVAIEPETNSGSLLIVEGYESEVIDPTTLQPIPDGEVGELVLTNPGRCDSPLARYRTGDLVRGQQTSQGRRLDGGILGRVDDMIHIRGNNIYPTAIESIIRRFKDIGEFQVRIHNNNALAELEIVIESKTDRAADLEKAIRDELHFRPKIVQAPAGSLPRNEMKSRRFVRVANQGEPGA